MRLLAEIIVLVIIALAGGAVIFQIVSSVSFFDEELDNSKFSYVENGTHVVISGIFDVRKRCEAEFFYDGAEEPFFKDRSDVRTSFRLAAAEQGSGEYRVDLECCTIQNTCEVQNFTLTK